MKKWLRRQLSPPLLDIVKAKYCSAFLISLMVLFSGDHTDAKVFHEAIPFK